VIRAHYRRLSKSAILTAPLGARTRPARQKGVFSAAKPPKKRILLNDKKDGN